VRVLSRLFRRLFLQMLLAAHATGRLRFFADDRALADRSQLSKRYTSGRTNSRREECLVSALDCYPPYRRSLWGPPSRGPFSFAFTQRPADRHGSAR
jgi:hypothetical protein